MTMPYVYKMVNKDTNQFYIGCRYTEGCDPDESFDVYASSSRSVKHMIRNNPSQWEKHILLKGDTELVMLEEQSLIQQNKHDPLCLNGVSVGYKQKQPKIIPKLEHTSNELVEQFMQSLGEFIRQERKKRGANSTEFSQYVGISRVSLHRIENGYVNVTADMLIKTLQALGMLDAIM